METQHTKTYEMQQKKSSKLIYTLIEISVYIKRKIWNNLTLYLKELEKQLSPELAERNKKDESRTPLPHSPGGISLRFWASRCPVAGRGEGAWLRFLHENCEWN